MKKGLKFGAMSLAMLLVFGVAGCGKISDKDGAAWAEKNGYVKAEGSDLKALPASVDTENADCDTAISENNTFVMYSTNCNTVDYTNLYEYMDREDSVYYDLRDEGSVKGSALDQYSAGHLKGFKNVDFFNYIFPTVLRTTTVPTGERGTTLFYLAEDGTFAPNYADSVKILEELFPKDKNLFLMCAAGSRVVTMMQILDQYGWDMSRVYNIGGFGDYSGDEYKDYVLTASTGNKLLEKTGTVTGKGEGTELTDNLSVTVKVLYTAAGEIMDVFVVSGTTSTDHVSATWNAEIQNVLDSFVGLTTDEAKEKITDGALTDENDAVSGATNSTTLIYRAVAAALADVVID